MIILMADRILNEENSHQFGEQLKSFAQHAGPLCVLINFSKVEYLSSAALGKLVVLRKWIEVKGKLALSNIDDSVIEEFKITGFDRIFTIFNDEQEALDYLQ